MTGRMPILAIHASVGENQQSTGGLRPPFFVRANMTFIVALATI